MTFVEELLSDDVRRAAAFDLLTSSNIERYADSAQSSMGAQRLRQVLRILPDLEPALVARARDSLRRILASKERSDAEIDLALILAALASSGSSAIDQVLAEVGLVDTPSAAWCAALARRLRRARAVSVGVRFSHDPLKERLSAINDQWRPIVSPAHSANAISIKNQTTEDTAA
jgi:hypothetical protein